MTMLSTRSIAATLALACGLLASCTNATPDVPSSTETSIAPANSAVAVDDTTGNVRATPPADPIPSPQLQVTHCSANESVLFSCMLDGSDRIVSLCAAPRPVDSHDVRYASGPSGMPDMVYPDSASPEFQRTSLTFAGGTGGYAYSFRHAGRTHVIYSISGDEGLTRQGEMLTDADIAQVSTDHSCDPGSVIESDDIALIRLVRSWPSQPRLEARGLPGAGR